MLSGHVRAWGRYHSRILDRWAANLGRSEGAIAEKAVPFPGAVRRSLVVLRFAALDPFTRRGFLRLFLPMLDYFYNVAITSLRHLLVRLLRRHAISIG